MCYFASFEKGAKLYWSRPWFRLDGTFALPQPHGCHPCTNHQPSKDQSQTPPHWCATPPWKVPPSSDMPPPLAGCGVRPWLAAAKYIGLWAKSLVNCLVEAFSSVHGAAQFGVRNWGTKLECWEKKSQSFQKNQFASEKFRETQRVFSLWKKFKWKKTLKAAIFPANGSQCQIQGRAYLPGCDPELVRCCAKNYRWKKMWISSFCDSFFGSWVPLFNDQNITKQKQRNKQKQKGENIVAPPNWKEMRENNHNRILVALVSLFEIPENPDFFPHQLPYWIVLPLEKTPGRVVPKSMHLRMRRERRHTRAVGFQQAKCDPGADPGRWSGDPDPSLTRLHLWMRLEGRAGCAA